MKSKFLFVMSVAATMLLASCNNMPATSSQPAASDDTSASATQGQVISVTCSTTEATLQLNETLQLDVTVEVTGGASNKVTYSSSNADVAEVKDSGLVTAKAVGDATITITAKADPSKSCTVAIHVAAVQYDAISGLTAGVAATVKGTCIATNNKSFILADETGAVMVYLNNKPSQEIGKVYTAKGTPVASAYSAGFTQFDSNAVIEEVTGETAMVPTAAPLTAEIAEGWVAAYNAATDKAGQYLTQDAMKLYKWETTVTMSGSYAVIKVAGSDVVIEPVYMDNKAFKLEEGKKYNVEGVYAGYRVPSSGSGYAQIVITKAEEKAAEVGDVTLASAENARVVKVDADLEMTASIYGVESGSVTWSLKEEGASALATLTPDTENGNKAILHGKAVGKVTVVATYQEKSAEMEITIESNAVDKTISQLDTLNEVVNLDVTVVALADTGYIVADATGHVYVRDGDHTPAVGDHLSLEAKVASYNGGKQLTINKYEAAQGTAPVAPAAMAMTEAIGLELAPITKAAKTAKTFAVGTATAPIGLYSWENVSFTGSGKYMYFDLGAAHFETTNTATGLLPEAGKNYDMEGVVYGTYTSNSIDYVTVIVTKLVERAAEQGTVSIEGPAAVNVGESIELQAAVVGGGDVTWSLKEEGASAIATLTPANDNKVSVTGVAAGNVTVVATCGDKSAEHAVQVKAAPQPGSLVAATIAKGTTNSYDDCTINGKFSVKAGKNGAGGNLTITVGAGATKLVFHACAWKKEASDITLSGAAIDPSTVSVLANDVFTGTAKAFTLDNEDSYKFEVNLSGIEAETVITVTTAKRVFVWDASYAVGNAAA